MGSSEFKTELKSLMCELRREHWPDTEVRFTSSARVLIQALYEEEFVAVCEQVQRIVDNRGTKTIRPLDWRLAMSLAKHSHRNAINQIVVKL